MSEQKLVFHGPLPASSPAQGDKEPVHPLAPLPALRAQPIAQPMSPARQASAGGDANQARFVLDALRRWWKVALPVGLVLAAIAGAVVYLTFQPQYEATALLEIEGRPQYIAFEPRTEGGRSKQYYLTQMELIRSAWVMGGVVDQPQIAAMPEIAEQADRIAWLSKKVRVSAMGDSDVFRISYSCPSPERAAAVVGAVTDVYLKRRGESEATQNHRIIQVLTKELDRRSGEVTARREEVRRLTQETTGKDPYLPQTQAEPIKHPLAELQGRLVMAQVELAMGNARIKAMDEELAALSQGQARKTKDAEAKAPLTNLELEIRNALVSKIIAENGEVRKQEENLLAKKANLQQARKVLQPHLCGQYEQEVASDQQLLDKLRQDMRARVQQEADLALRAQRMESDAGTLAKRREEVSRMRCEARANEIAVENLKQAYEVQLKGLKSANGSSVDLVFKKDELAQAEKVYDRIAGRLLELQTEQGAPARIALRQPALVPAGPLEAFPMKTFPLAVLVGLCAPFGLAVGWESLVRRISSSKDLEQRVQLAVLGEIAQLPTRRRGGRAAQQTALATEIHTFEESIESLRTALMLSEDLKDMRILAITSAANHEGKTSVAAQLATSLALATSEEILVIDGDLRSPRIHSMFDVPRQPGLADVLSHQCPLQEAIHVREGESVHILPAGRADVSPHRLLGNGTWKALLAQIPASYRYVIIDTPPVLAASEALVLTKAADATLVCVMRDVSRGEQVQKAARQLLAAGSRPVGLVLNGVPTREYGYRYGKYPAHSS